jgi:hypothetical protein
MKETFANSSYNSEVNEGFEVPSYKLSDTVLEILGEKEATPRVYAIATYRRFHPNTRILDAKEFVDNNLIDSTPSGDPIWKTPDAAAIFVGGVAATGEQGTMVKSSPDSDFDIPTTQYSVQWNEEGLQGGVGGGIKTWHKKDEVTGKLTKDVLGYTNF